MALKNFSEKAILIVALPIVAWMSLLIATFMENPLPASPAEFDGNALSDFVAFATGAKIVRDGKISELYNPQLQSAYQATVLPRFNLKGVMTFRTPPTTAILYSLLPIDNLILSFWITALINTVLITCSIYILRKSKIQASALMFLSIFVVSVGSTVFGGQTTGLLIFLISACYKLLEKNYALLAGILIGLLFIKPNFLIVAPLIFAAINSWDKKIKFAGGFILTVLVMLALNTAVYGQNFAQDYIRFVSETENSSYGTDIGNNTNLVSIVYAFSTAAGVHYSPLWGVVASTALYIIVFTILLSKKSPDFKWKFVIAMVLLPLINVHTMHTDMLVHLIPAVMLSPALFKGTGRLQAAIIFAIFVVLPYLSYAGVEWLVALITLSFSFYLLFGNRKVFKI